MDKVFVRSPYNYDRRAASEETSLKIPRDEEDMAQQQYKDECDINTIMKRFGVTGELQGGNNFSVNVGDFTDVVDFHTAMGAVREATESFMQLPSSLRKRFNHDPGELLKFVADNSNYAEAQRLGLIPPPAPVVKAPPLEVRVVAEPPSGGAAPPSGGV